MSIIDFIKPSLQGSDGKSSARALTNFWYVALNSLVSIATVVLAYIIVLDKNETKYAIDVLWVLVWVAGIYNLTILVIYGIVSFQNITEGIRAFRGQPASPVEVETKTVTTVTPTDSGITIGQGGAEPTRVNVPLGG